MCETYKNFRITYMTESVCNMGSLKRRIDDLISIGYHTATKIL